MKKLLLVFAAMLVSCGGDDNECPDGGSLHGIAGDEQWCAIPDGDGGWVKHGPYWRWDDVGHVSQTGEYCHGVGCGRWNNWHDNSSKASEIYYTIDGDPCGTWLAWDDQGNVTNEIEYDPC